ncbi:hypothetical protein JXR01_00360 [Candidatus Kaiserbacteria bacterium]|nr:MAG: hypothetical protein JXR01_00360 [Candidatus Kaiserbacteria bacterium]
MDIFTSAAAASTDSSLWEILFYGIVVIFLLYSAVLIFHWFSFSMRPRTAIGVTILYVTLSVVFLIFMTTSFFTLISL